MDMLQPTTVIERASSDWKLLAQGVGSITKRMDGKETLGDPLPFYEFGDSPSVRIRLFGAEGVPVGTKITAPVRLFGKFPELLTEHFCLTNARLDFQYAPDFIPMRDARIIFHTDAKEYTRPHERDRCWYINEGVIVWRAVG